jgi:hypothetical protein
MAQISTQAGANLRAYTEARTGQADGDGSRHRGATRTALERYFACM